MAELGRRLAREGTVVFAPNHRTDGLVRRSTHPAETSRTSPKCHGPKYCEMVLAPDDPAGQEVVETILHATAAGRDDG